MDSEARISGVTTWPANMWRTGAGSSWGFISYDPDLKLIYYGTTNPGPRVPAQRPGDNLWTSTMFARDPDTGHGEVGLSVHPARPMGL